MSREVERRILRHLHDRRTQTRLLEIHAHFLRHQLHQSNQVLSHFVAVCRANGKMRHAELVFQQTQFPDLLLFNSMIKGYSVSGPFEKSLSLFSLMKNNGVLPNEYTFAPLIKSCCNIRDSRGGKFVHGEIMKLGFERRNAVRIGIVEFYANCEKMEDAKKVFDEMPQRDVIIWNLMIRGFCMVGDIDMGLLLFRQMRERSIVSWNSMISSLAKSGRDKEALGVFRDMEIDGCFEPDEATVVSVLPVCGRLGAFDVGNRLHSYAKSSGLFRDFITVGNSIVSFYCKCGDLETAHQVFCEMPRKNVISWNTLISGLAFNGKGELGVDLFEKMLSKGIKPNDSSYVGALTCCVHAGLLQKGRHLFSLMTVKHKILPKLEHYGCMVDLLGRSGCLSEAYDLVKNMPMRPNAVLWGALLSASRNHGDVQLAEQALKELIILEPWNSGNYVLLSNIYAEEGKWDEVDKLRVLMKDSSVRKSIGLSLVG
ncbi:pentatricopeptide repeat-containing protein At1g09190-like [Chenopodium quinoa]|uniref:pentatricopeptide repeat-containing protein At1g09190-like n=1 Tax=Chenopodium quinoa TaxID=63459 RepID=UPI000B78B145|nr:pentatricopeptide repeat-containing protein At1g09190-like [Chenopodium quinoa]